MSAPEAERLARVALSRLAEPGDRRVLDLVQAHGGLPVVEALQAERDLLGLRTDWAERLRECDPTRDLDRATKLGLRFVVPGDEEWPASLDDLCHAESVHDRGGPPVGLWVRGPARLDALAASVAIVGCRSATTYGTEVATDLALDAARAGLSVVSGAAFGIDQAAHRGAFLGDGPTVAVLACGADRIYPKAHEQLLAAIAAEGAVVSEAAPGEAPTRIRFLARNRLIAALTRGTVVVEAAVRSGALNTSAWAERLGRVVMAVPGPVTSVQSQGTNRMLSTGRGVAVGSGAELLELLAANGEHLVKEPRGSVTDRDRLTNRQRQVLDAVPVGSGAGALSVSRTAGIGLLEVQRTLARLETVGLVRRDPDGWLLSRAALQPGA